MRTAGTKTIILFLIGIALAIFGNVVRSLFLSFTANGRGVEGIRTYHDAAGWSILVFTAGGVILFAWWLSKSESSLDRPLNAPAVESWSLSSS